MGKDQDLLDAARSGNIEMVGKICSLINRRRGGPLVSIRWRPNINVQDMNGYTPLHHACLNGHAEVVRLLLEHDAAVDVPDIRGSTPLFLASWAGHRDIIKMLLFQSRIPANPNMQTIENDTPLHCAAQNGNNEALAILLRHSGDPSIRNNSFQTALDLAAQFGRLQAVQILLHSHPELIDPLRIASDCERSEMLRNDLSGHSPPYESVMGSTNTTDTPVKTVFTHTCLHLASRNGHKEVVKTLLNAGVDVNILTNAGTALHEAALCGKKSVVLMLLEAGVDPYAVDGNGHTALDILRDYPPHVTYEIVSAINDFCQAAGNMVDRKVESPFRPITDENENRADFISRNGGGSGGIDSNKIFSRHKHYATTPRRSKSPEGGDNVNAFEKEFRVEMKSSTTAATKPIPKKLTSNIRSNSVESLRVPFRAGNYVPMKPIPPVVTKPATYQPVYKTPSISPINFATRSLYNNTSTTNGALLSGDDGLKSISYERLNRPNTNIPSTKENSGSYHCVDQYVKMSKSPIGFISTAAISLAKPIPPPPLLPLKTKKKPLPAPRTMQTEDYANLDKLEVESVREQIVMPPLRSGSSTPTNLLPLSRRRQRHSPTPEFPPPSVSQAENTIFEFIQPSNTTLSKRKSLYTAGGTTGENDLKDASAFIWDNATPPSSDDIGFDTRSSRTSDYVEEFVGDEPFAGLFKGSTLTLNINGNGASGGSGNGQESQDCCDGKEGRKPCESAFEEDQTASGLRSPSLVKAVQPIAMKRQYSVVQQTDDTRIIKPQSMVTPQTKSLLGGSQQNISKGWEEIDSILQSIGSEVQHASESVEFNVADAMTTSQESSSSSQKKELTNDSIRIRQPVDLAMSSIEENMTTSWCHSSNTLIYGHVQYKVYYLGSTVIRELRGTISTRKSIQKLKLDENIDSSALLENCNNSTKILKANNQQTRLKVGISLSHVGVRFIDAENGTTICVHEIENINCVCQDSEDLRYFAYITKEKDIHYCHVFMVDNLDLATEIILTLGQAFEVAFQLALRKQVDDEGDPVQLGPSANRAILIANV